MAARKPKPIRVKWVLNYGQHYAEQYIDARDSDREALIAYGEIVEESVEGVVHTYVVEYADLDGWDVRGQVEETEAQIGGHGGAAERVQ